MLESKLLSYIKDPQANAAPFDCSEIQKISRDQASREMTSKNPLFTLLRCLYHEIGPNTLETIAPAVTEVTVPSPEPNFADIQSIYTQQLASIPEFEAYGPLLNSSSKQIQLTERETEYQVSCVKHIFAEHVVFQVSNSYM